ncbi:uncharacterized protein VP01_2630g1, partial [Puccinia sorghi]
KPSTALSVNLKNTPHDPNPICGHLCGIFCSTQSAYIFNQILHQGKDITLIERVLGRKPSLGMLQVFCCDAYAYDHNHTKLVVPYTKKMCQIGVSSVSKAWLLWRGDTGKVMTSASVRFDEAPIIHGVYVLTGTVDSEAVVLVIVYKRLGDFRLGDVLDEQDVAVSVMKSRDLYGSDSPLYEVAVKLPEAEEWRAAMGEEMKLLEDHQVHMEDDLLLDPFAFMVATRDKWRMQGALR